MYRVTIRVPEAKLDAIDQLVARGEFPNRSEAIRAAIRDLCDDHEVPVRASRRSRLLAADTRQEGE